jgi:hypothetical protein
MRRSNRALTGCAAAPIAARVIEIALAASLVGAGCDASSPGPDPDTDAAAPSSCSDFTDCVSCGDARTPGSVIDDLDCAWCAGTCMLRPQDTDVDDDRWCEWGFVENGRMCADDGGARLVRTRLDVDCRSTTNESDPRCAEPEDDNAAEVGAGLRFPGGLGGLTGGFVDDDRVVLGAWDNRPGDELGSIWTVDLATGDRELVSGSVEDSIVGPMSAGSGPALGQRVLDVEPSTDGAWIAFTTAGLFRVDPASGAREQLFAFGSPSSCVHTGVGWGITTSGGAGLAVGSDGTMYVPAGEDESGDDYVDVGIFAVSPGGSCRMLTMSSPLPARLLGAGPLASIHYRGLALEGSTLYALEGFGRIHAIDVATGDRRLVSSELESVGDGPPANYEYFMLPSAGVAWTSGDSSDSFEDATRALTHIELESGDRTLRWSYRAPIGSSGDVDWIAPHPALEGVAVAVTAGDALVLYHLESASSLLLSH